MPGIPKVVDLASKKNYRIIPSVYPPVNFFGDLVDPSEMEALWEIESLTNERLRQQAGDIFLVPAEDRVAGPGSSVVMAAFTHISAHRPSRFTDGSFGIYYASLLQETAIRETVYHREQFLSSTNEESCELTMRLYEGKIIKPLHDIRNNKFNHLLNPHHYLTSQQFGQKLRNLKSWGLIYNSVRHNGGHCIAAFRPPAISIPIQLSHLRYIWDGKKITEVLDTTSLIKF